MPEIRYPLYSCNTDDSWRYLLGKPGKKYMAIIGLNPSTANMLKPDTTVAKCETVCTRAGFDGFLMLNLYPVRATDYNRLPTDPNPKAYNRNIEAIRDIFAQHPGMMTWAAWGRSILARDFFVMAAIDIIKDSRDFNINWVNFGALTEGGYPRHPSRLSYSWLFSAFDSMEHLWTLNSALQMQTDSGRGSKIAVVAKL